MNLAGLTLQMMRQQAHAGEATAGKTQTCLQLLLSVQWPKSRGGLEGSAL